MLPPEIGRLQFIRNQWSSTDFSYVEIESHTCTPKELGLEESNDGKYMKPTKASYNFVKLYQKKFLCINEEDRFVRGNFQSEAASLIQVRLNRCSGEDYCKSKEEIDEFVRGKYILLYLNRVRFQSNYFGEESI